MSFPTTDSITAALELGLPYENFVDHLLKVFPEESLTKGFIESQTCFFLTYDQVEIMKLSLDVANHAALYTQINKIKALTRILPPMALAELTAEFKLAVAFVNATGVDDAIAWVLANELVLARTGVDCHKLLKVKDFTTLPTALETPNV